MTVPWLHNCPHRDDSWCLDCTKALGEQLWATENELRELKGEGSDDNVLIWPGTTMHALPVDRIARAAQRADLLLCIIVGVDKGGDFYFASSEGDCTMVLWQLERAKRELFKRGGE